jgi:predicted O-methyltransferase YrrM
MDAEAPRRQAHVPLGRDPATEGDVHGQAVAADRWAAVDRYVEELLLADDAALPGSGGAAVSPAQGKLLHLLARVTQARAILELGTFEGYSTIWLARALPPDGRLVSLEIDPERAEAARANVERAGLAGLVEIRVGPAGETLAELAGPFDLVFIDADKRSNPDYLERALELSRPGTLIVADNVVRGGALVDPESADPSVQGVRRFHELLAAQPNVSATTIQTVGSKGYDGFTIALVG